MRIAIPTDDSDGLNAVINPYFGRSTYFTIIDLNDGLVKNTETIANPNQFLSLKNAPLTVNLLVNKQIDLIIGENYDPNTSLALQEMRIHRFDIRIQNPTKVKNAISQYLEFLDKSSS